MALWKQTPLATQRVFADETVGVAGRASFYYLQVDMKVYHFRVLVFLVLQGHVNRLEARGAVLTGKYLAEVLDLRSAENRIFLANYLIHCQEERVEEVDHQ